MTWSNSTNILSAFKVPHNHSEKTEGSGLYPTAPSELCSLLSGFLYPVSYRIDSFCIHFKVQLTPVPPLQKGKVEDKDEEKFPTHLFKLFSQHSGERLNRGRARRDPRCTKRWHRWGSSTLYCPCREGHQEACWHCLSQWGTKEPANEVLLELPSLQAGESRGNSCLSGQF